MKTLYFKIKTGYDKNEYVVCDETELEKAYFAFLTDAKTIIAGRPIRGKDIIDILPHYGKMLGYAESYDFGKHPEDWADAQKAGIKTAAPQLQQLMKERVQYLMENNQTHLIGKNAEIPALDAPQAEGSKLLSAQRRDLTNKMKI